ncbi:uncharacterized protein LOC100678997 isoform X2 [Nasonia vitripennis]|uniref:Uncharacterized protein n=1 Tax=Nasonia vitripennis TaxID=7425 RepID=A0A7M7Q0B7_NASVI|nr:uncharacterized protein LOC100678997 isoform X2 [Nasonia vitripennis]
MDTRSRGERKTATLCDQLQQHIGKNGSASIEQKNGNGNNKASKTNNNGAEVNRNEEQNGSLDKSQAKKKPQAPGGGPLLQQTEISTSQLDFFRMLDEKIESGPDYDESADSHRAEHVTGLLRRWELASVSWSNVADLSSSSSSNSNAFKQQQHAPSSRPLASLQQAHRGGAYKSLPPPISGLGSNSLSAKDREGMRNIIGGRPESAPVYVRSAAARVDGLQDVVHHAGPSPNMPRHVLESISQSPTQNLKTPPGVSSPTPGSRYQHYHHPDFQQQSQPVKVTKAQYSQGPSPLNGDYYARQGYDSPGPNALIRNSPSNPYVQQFQITSSPQAPVQQLSSAAQRKRQSTGFQMT